MKTKFYLDRKSFFGKAAVTALLLSILFRLIGSIGRWGSQDYLYFGLILPVAACLLITLAVFFLGKRAVWATAPGVAAGMVFLAVRIFNRLLRDDFVNEKFADQLWMAGVIAFYVVITVLYILTVFQAIQTKWIVTVLFALPVIYHFYNEYRTLAYNESVLAGAMMNEISSLAMLCGMFFITAGLKKAYKVVPSSEIVPPVPGDSLSGKKPVPSQPAAAQTAPAQPAAAQTAPAKPAKPVVVPELETAREEVPSFEHVTEHETAPAMEPVTVQAAGGKANEADKADEAAPAAVAAAGEAVPAADAAQNVEDWLDSLPESGPLTLDPVVPERREEAPAESEKEEPSGDEAPGDVPQGEDEPERLDAMAPGGGIRGLMSKFGGKK